MSFRSWSGKSRAQPRLGAYKPLRPNRAARRVRGTAGKAGRRSSETALAVAKRALRLAAKTRSKVEVKLFEFNLINQDVGTDVTAQWGAGASGAVIGNGGAVFSLTYGAQGVTDLLRLGEQIQVEGVEIRGHIMSNENYMNLATRFILFRDDQTRPGNIPITAEILQFNRTNSVYSWDTRSRYTIFMDETVQMTANTNPFGARQPFHFKKKLSFLAQYANQLANSCEKNQLCLLVISDYGNTATGDTTDVISGAGSGVVIDLTARLLFTDP